MKKREYLNPKYTPLRLELTQELKPSMNYMQQMVMVYSKIQNKKELSEKQTQLKGLADNLFDKAMPVIRKDTFSALGKVSSEQTRMYPYGDNTIVKYAFTGEFRTVHSYNLKTNVCISITQPLQGLITVTISKFQLIHGIHDMERNWKLAFSE